MDYDRRLAILSFEGSYSRKGRFFFKGAVRGLTAVRFITVRPRLTAVVAGDLFQSFAFASVGSVCYLRDGFFCVRVPPQGVLCSARLMFYENVR